MDFTKNLRNSRHNVGLTQQSLGEKIGVTSVTIGNWERGARQPLFELLPKLADALDTSVDALLGRQITRRDPAEEELLEKYRQLDAHGQKLVSLICDAELERIRPHQHEVVRTARQKPQASKHNRYIPFYLTPPAAGISVPLEGDEFEMLLADESVPADADYAVRVSGDSMEPYICDGEIVFVKDVQELCDGDIGIFCVDGAMYCKQYHVDEKNNLHLLSLNPERTSANIFVNKDGGSSVRCCGKVCLKK